MIKGISYITFIVRDLNRTADLFQKVLDAEEVYGSGIKSHPPIYWEIIPGRRTMDCCYAAKGNCQSDISSCCIKVDADRMGKAGLEIRPTRTRAFEGKGKSIYFYTTFSNCIPGHGKNDWNRITKGKANAIQNKSTGSCRSISENIKDG